MISKILPIIILVSYGNFTKSNSYIFTEHQNAVIISLTDKTSEQNFFIEGVMEINIIYILVLSITSDNLTIY